MSLDQLLILLTVAVTLALILIRPRGLSEAWAAAGGASVMLLVSPLAFGDLPDVFDETQDVLLFCSVFLLGALITALLSLDVTVIVLTPIVYTVAVRRRLDPIPFLFACTFVANTVSLALPISN